MGGDPVGAGSALLVFGVGLEQRLHEPRTALTGAQSGTVLVSDVAQPVVSRVIGSFMGIPPEDVPRIFERFFTGANGRLKQASTGMGLYLAAEICRRLGHELAVETAVGEGSTFMLTVRPRGLHLFG